MAKERIVIKIGSSSLTNAKGGLSREKLQGYVNEIADLKQAGHEVILISSGAVAAGFTEIGYPSRPVTIGGKQAAAAVGQGILMQAYTEELKKHNISAGQILLTRDNFSSRSQHKNAYTTLTELLHRKVLPIINENDSIAVDELTFGDNDLLSALVSGLVHAQTLIILTDINGIYDANPNDTPSAKRYHFLPEITEELLTQAGSSGSKVGTGGMRSKLEAAKTALSLGVSCFIGSGENEGALRDILSGKGDGTYIGFPGAFILKNKKQWISLHSQVSGQVIIDDGARDAILYKGKSLLPAGVVDFYGSFSKGAVVEVIDEKGNVLGKGQINVSSTELKQIKGKPSQEALYYTKTARAEVIHRDDWVHS
ncbi:glutamate 5-kinase [Bacillus sp. FJAT-44742]|uniref:glutamate 5-kinase n=1 Tax=Bacillus sp. FJAT-44742 TaxID=2014005 RepID=UPI000C23DB24|nr:glutamate 5-kinase [Bacillus sp. FJAT-44742]